MLTLFPRISTLNKLVLKFEVTLYRHWTLETFRIVPFLSRHSDALFQTGPMFHRCIESHKALLDLTSPERMLLNTSLRPIVILPKLKIREFCGEMDVVGDH